MSTLCVFYHESGNIRYKGICFYKGSMISSKSVKESTMCDSVLSENIYVNGNHFLRNESWAIDLFHYQKWKQTKSGDWDWYIEETIPELVSIDNYLEIYEKDLEFKYVLEGTLDFIDKHSHSMKSTGILSLKMR